MKQLVGALRSARDGDFSVRLRGDGAFGEVAAEFNEMVERNQRLARELIRVSKVIGREGKITERAASPGGGKAWEDQTSAVNALIDDLVRPMTEIARVIDAVADGDLSQRITVKMEGQALKGEFLRIGTTVNAMVDQLSSFADEVTRVAREVGTEGKLGGQAKVKGVSGTWKDLTDSVNQMASNLTGQVRNIAEVTTAVATGDLSKKVTVDVKGEVLELKNTVNTMVDQLSTFADEVTRVAREVGSDGKLGGQAQVRGVSGVWKDLTENVNTLAGNLTGQVRNIALVTTAVANGDLSRKITVDARGEVLELKETINTMVDQLRSFSQEVTRVAKEVGTEGKLGGQAQVEDVSGVWRDLTENVNTLAGNLTSQVRNIAEVTTAVATGDLSKKITVDVRGEVLELKETVNTMVDQLRAFSAEVTRVAREVGTEGKLGGQAQVEGVSGVWKDLTDNVNTLAGNLTSQVRNIALVTTAVANGDLSRKITVDVKGEILELKDTINTMVDQLSSFAAEVTRVAREVGTEGRLGGQAQVEGVSGTWRGLTENVNTLADNLTDQVRNIAEVTTAVANGDLSKKISVDAKGEVLELKNTINTMVDQLSTFAAEVTRVAREVGTEGKLGGQAAVEDVSGVWRGLTENVNFMAANLTFQVRNIADVTTAVAKGDLSQKITVDAEGEIALLKNTINTMVDQLSSFADEVTRVAREVGTEGALGGQAQVEGVSGTWRGLTENVNFMAANLTGQVRNIAQVATAVAKGDLSQKITVDAKGEILELKNTLNTMVDQLSSFADEVTRVAREVGSEGRLGGQAQVEGVSGTWRGLTENVNMMASNLTDQVRDIAQVATAVATGDLSQKITVDARGEILELKSTINTMVDQLSSFADEVTRVAREVGTEGKLGGQAQVEGVSGTWRGLTESVNFMAANLTGQVRNIADVATAVAKGDLSQKITVDAKGEILQLKNTLNTMVDQLSSFADEVTRVAREVGTEGKLGGQAQVKGVSGTWRGLTDNVNFMASSLTEQVRNIAAVTTAVANGDLSKKITVDVKGEMFELKDTVNTMVDQLRSFAAEVTRVAREVGTDGRLGGQAQVEGVSGVWEDLTDNVNTLAGNLTSQVRNIALVTTAVANGDLSKKITVDVKGEVLELKDTINTMVDQLATFAAEVTRVAREVGTEGALGGQAEVVGVSGTWKDLTDNVNQLAGNLTGQVRAIADVTTAVAKGDLSQKITVEAKGEIAQLSGTINTMVDQLSTFAAEVTRVAKEVGTEGKLGGQAQVEGVSGTWKDLTDNVNQLAETLTIQLRAIADVSTAVTSGDLTRSITVEAAGEVAELKDNINQMISNLRGTTDQNAQQDWLNSNLARFSGLLQGQRDMKTVARLLMSEVTPARRRPPWRLLRRRGSRPRRGAELRAARDLRLQGAEVDLEPLQARRVDRRAGGARAEVDRDHAGARGLHQDRLRARRGGSGQHHRDPGALRGERPRGARGGLLHALHRGAADVPRPALGVDRRRPEHDPGEFEDRGAARAVAIADAGAAEPVRGAPVPAGRAEALEHGARGAGPDVAGVRGAAPDPAGGAAADERGARGALAAARGAEPADRDQERGDRAGPLGARGEGGAALPLLEVQVRVPREHVARAADAAQLAADPRKAARRQPGREPDREADRVLEDDPPGGLGPARPDQRHPGSLEGGGRADGRQRRRRLDLGRARLARACVRGGRRGEGARLRARGHPRLTGDDRDRSATAPAGAPEPALERAQVHRARHRHAPGRTRGSRAAFRGRDPLPGGARGRILGGRHGDRDPGRQAAADLRGLSAGRRDDEPALRRNRARPLDQPRDRPPARRRDSRRVDARRGEHVHALPPGSIRLASGGTHRRRAVAGSRRRHGHRPGATGGDERRRAPSGARARRCVRRRPARALRGRGRSRADRRGRPRRPDRRGRSLLRPDRACDRPRAWLQGARRVARRRRARARPRVPARRDRARHDLAGSRRLDRARPAQAPPVDAPHPRAHRLQHRRTPAGAPGRRGRLHPEAGIARGARARLRRDRDVHRARGSTLARRRRRRDAAPVDHRARRQRRRRRGGRRRARARERSPRSRRRVSSTAWSST